MTDKELIEKVSVFFMENGYKRSLDGFAQRERISKKTIYKSYRTKENLIKAVFDYRMDIVKNSLLLPSQSDENALSLMLSNMLRLQDYMKPAQQRKNLLDLKKYYPDIYVKVVEKIEDIIFAKLIPVVEAGMKEGLFLPDLNPKIVSTIYKKIFIYLRITTSESPEIVEEIMRESYLMFARGLLTTKGLAEYENLKDTIARF